jgi:dihydrofolate reductase
VATSLDGYLAKLDDNLEWLNQFVGEDDHGYGEMYSRIATLVMGRKTYDIINRLASPYPHNDRITYIFSNQTDLHDTQTVRIVRGVVKLWYDEYTLHNDGDVWLVGGGALVAQFLEAKLVNQIILTIAPILLGKGIPLWQPISTDSQWTLQTVKQSGQFAQLFYVRQQQ